MLARDQRALTASSNEITLGLNLLVHAFDDYSMNALELITSLPLCHPKLIDWNSPSSTSDVLTFQNDYVLASYLNVVKPIMSSTSENSVNMMEGDIKYLSHKIKQRKNRCSDN